MGTVTRVGMVLAAVVTLLVSCSSPMMEKGNQLEVSARDYLQRLRWKDFHGAAAFMKEEYREDFLARMDGIKKDLQMVNVTLVYMEPGKKEDEYQTVANLEYYVLPSLTLKEKELRQNWVIVTSGAWGSAAAWMIDSQFPDFP
jgi:hypothetical protein